MMTPLGGTAAPTTTGKNKAVVMHVELRDAVEAADMEETEEEEGAQQEAFQLSRATPPSSAGMCSRFFTKAATKINL